jgi:hypothetical protein
MLLAVPDFRFLSRGRLEPGGPPPKSAAQREKILRFKLRKTPVSMQPATLVPPSPPENPPLVTRFKFKKKYINNFYISILFKFLIN